MIETKLQQIAAGLAALDFDAVPRRPGVRLADDIAAAIGAKPTYVKRVLGVMTHDPPTFEHLLAGRVAAVYVAERDGSSVCPDA